MEEAPAIWPVVFLVAAIGVFHHHNELKKKSQVLCKLLNSEGWCRQSDVVNLKKESRDNPLGDGRSRQGETNISFLVIYIRIP